MIKDSFARVGAVVNVDVRLRLRKSSTIVTFILLCLAAYSVVPDPANGRTLITIDGHRAVYNSEAIALATATLCSVFLGLFGFYLISNSIQRDINTGTGFLIASTPIKNFEYLTGKFLGNILFLSVIAFAFMLNAMVMHLLRGEVRLQPLIYIEYYLLLLPPMIVFISIMALVFEISPAFSGKVGDSVFFIVWMLSLLPSIAVAFNLNFAAIGSYFDIYGIGIAGKHLQQTIAGKDFGMGSVVYDTEKSPVFIGGLVFSVSLLQTRIVSSLVFLPLLVISWRFFHRFDPSLIKINPSNSRQPIIDRINRIISPITAKITAVNLISHDPARGYTLMRSVNAEFLLILRLSPLILIEMLLLAIIALLVPLNILQEVILPLIFLLLAISAADISVREENYGTMHLLYGMPMIKSYFVVWKYMATLLIAFGFTLVPLVRILITVSAYRAFSLLIGTLFFSSSAICLGVVTKTSKAFIVISLLFLYLVSSDKGRSIGFDFAGWYGIATVKVQASYFLLALGMFIFTQIVVTWRLRAN